MLTLVILLLTVVISAALIVRNGDILMALVTVIMGRYVILQRDG
jgi:hypothetical protein